MSYCSVYLDKLDDALSEQEYRASAGIIDYQSNYIDRWQAESHQNILKKIETVIANNAGGLHCAEDLRQRFDGPDLELLSCPYCVAYVAWRQLISLDRRHLAPTKRRIFGHEVYRYYFDREPPEPPVALKYSSVSSHKNAESSDGETRIYRVPLRIQKALYELDLRTTFVSTLCIMKSHYHGNIDHPRLARSINYLPWIAHPDSAFRSDIGLHLNDGFLYLIVPNALMDSN